MKKTCFLLVILLMAIAFCTTGCVTEEITYSVLLDTEIISFEGSRVEIGITVDSVEKRLLSTGDVYKLDIAINTYEGRRVGDEKLTRIINKTALKFTEVNFEYDQDLFEIYTDTQTGMIFIKALAICDESPLTITTVYNGVEYLHQYLIWVRD